MDFPHTTADDPSPPAGADDSGRLLDWKAWLLLGATLLATLAAWQMSSRLLHQ